MTPIEEYDIISKIYVQKFLKTAKKQDVLLNNYTFDDLKIDTLRKINPSKDQKIMLEELIRFCQNDPMGMRTIDTASNLGYHFSIILKAI